MCCIASVLSRIQWPVLKPAKAAVVFFGRNTYVVLAFHQVILMILGKLQVTFIGSLQRLLMWIVLSLLIYIINKYLPFVLGRNVLQKNGAGIRYDAMIRKKLHK